ncbi:MAG TPA: ABC transporter substrate-binding protein [Dongiaceae bacterium]|jgi:hypothetical protein|nr:ABC transporter substrate-binding protein [Dongiaceae bacterium]
MWARKPISAPFADNRIRLGISAALEPAKTIHKQTLIAAVQTALALQPPILRKRIHLVWKSDRMSPQGGRLAADALIRAGVDAVVGHYNSGAAEAALARYRRAGIPALLPTASEDGLTRNKQSSLHPHFVFRLGATNNQIAMAAHHHICTQRGLTNVTVWEDGSSYARKLASSFKKINSLVPKQKPDSHAHLFLGHQQFVIRHIRATRDQGDGDPIFILDDSVHPDSLKDLKNNQKIGIFGITPSDIITKPSIDDLLWKLARIYGIVRDTPYFLATVAAMEIGILIAKGKDRRKTCNGILASGCDTILGKTFFTENGDNANPLFALWCFSENRFQPVEYFRLSKQFSFEMSRSHR